MEETKTQQEAPQPQQPSSPEPKKEGTPPEPKVLYYILSFVISLFGIIFGIIYMTKDNTESKKFGKICLILGVAPMVLGCLCWVIMMVFGVGTSFLGGTTDYSTY